jgi:type I restriction enzyme M protein
MFIDASAEFEKNGNQNTLTDAHVEKIIKTYQKREGVEKYAYVASLDEILENDYNLNIPRYVDTFEEEKQVDIEAVTKELNALESNIQKTEGLIADFCAELGIPAPFKVNA